jgi:hypothetical protein
MVVAGEFLKISSVSTAKKFASWARKPREGEGSKIRNQWFLPDGHLEQGRWHSVFCPWAHISLRCAYLCSRAPGGRCHTLSVGKQASESRGGLLISQTTLGEWGATNCLGEACPLLMAWDLKVKHRDSNSILKVAIFSLLCDYAYRNSCFVYEPDSPAIKTKQ